MSDLREAFFGKNIDSWGPEQWFDRLVKAVRKQDEAVLAKDDAAFSICQRVAASSATRLVRCFEQQVREALSAQPHPEAVEAVAWRVRMDGEISWWLTYSNPKFTRGVAEAIPLYTTPPLATDTERMRRALKRELDDCQSAVDAIEHHRDTANETQNGNYRFYQGRVVSLKFALQSLSGAADASNASAEARLPGMDWELSDDAKSLIAENDRYIVRPGDPRLNQIIGGPRPAGADEGKKSEGRTDEAKARDVDAASGSAARENHGSVDEAGMGSERSSPSDPTPAEQRKVQCEFCFGSGRHQGRFGGPDWPSCTNCRGKGTLLDLSTRAGG